MGQGRNQKRNYGKNLETKIDKQNIKTYKMQQEQY